MGEHDPKLPLDGHEQMELDVSDTIEVNGAAMIPDEYPLMERKVDEIRDMAQEAGVADIFPEEGNFALNAINMFVEQNAYPSHEGDAILMRYVLKYCLERP